VKVSLKDTKGVHFTFIELDEPFPRFIRLGTTVYEQQLDDYCCFDGYQQVEVKFVGPVPKVGQLGTGKQARVKGITVGSQYMILAIDDRPMCNLPEETHTVTVLNDEGVRKAYYWPSQIG